MMHALEARRFFSAALEDGRLHVVGTSGDDRIVVELVGDGEFSTPDTYRVTVNGRQTSFATDQIKSVFIEGLGGNDKIVHGRDYPGSPFFTIISPLDADALILGGGGDDTIVAGGGNDVLVGGRGDDLLMSRGGNDRVEGGDDQDTLNGGFGSDDLRGGTGVDLADYSDRTLKQRVSLDDVGDDGAIEAPPLWYHPDDSFYGITHPAFREGDNAHSDLEDIRGGSKNDTLTGSGGPNTIEGGRGNDIIRGMAGKDFLSGGAGDDRLEGGGGNGKGGDFYKGGDGNDSADDFLIGQNVASRDVEHGTFIGRFRTDVGAVGGDTTGYVLESLDGSVRVDLVMPENLKEQAAGLGGKVLRIDGHFTLIGFSERGVVRGITVDEFHVDFAL